MPSGDAATGVADADGRPVPTQGTADGLLVHDPARRVPGLGWAVLDPGNGASAAAATISVTSSRTADGAVIENDLLGVEIGADGTIHRLFDKEAGRDALDGRGNQLWAFVDKLRMYDAWDVEETYEAEGEEVGGVERIEVIEAGPLRGAVRVARVWRGSRIEQTYRLLAGSRRLDVATVLDAIHAQG